MFEIKDKIALVTGGACGIGFYLVNALLKNGIKGISIVDINEELGQEAVRKIDNEFGKNKAIFVKADVSKYKEFDEAFLKTVSHFKNLDILINNAGILHDGQWERTIDINYKGVLQGMMLATETYISKYKSGDEGVIINISSTGAMADFPVTPVYNSTKAAIVALSRGFGHNVHYNRTKVRIVALCPGITNTQLYTTLTRNNCLNDGFGEVFDKVSKTILYSLQEPEVVGNALIKVIKEAPSGTVWIAAENVDVYEYFVPSYKEFAPK